MPEINEELNNSKASDPKLEKQMEIFSNIDLLHKERDAKFSKLDKEIEKVSPLETDTLIGCLKNQPIFAHLYLKHAKINIDGNLPFTVSIKSKEDFQNLLRTIEKSIPQPVEDWAPFSNCFNKTIDEICKIVAIDPEKIIGKGERENIFESSDFMEFFLSSKAFCYTNDLDAEYTTANYNLFEFISHRFGNVSSLMTSSSLCPEEFRKANFYKPFGNDEKIPDPVEVKETLDNLRKIKENYKLNDKEFISFIANSCSAFTTECYLNASGRSDFFKDLFQFPEIQNNKEDFDLMLARAIDFGTYSAEFSMVANKEYLFKNFVSILYENNFICSINAFLNYVGYSEPEKIYRPHTISETFPNEDTEKLTRALKRACPDLPNTISNPDLPEDVLICQNLFIASENRHKEKYSRPNRPSREAVDTYYIRPQEIDELIGACTLALRTQNLDDYETIKDMFINLGLREKRDLFQDEMFFPAFDSVNIIQPFRFICSDEVNKYEAEALIAFPVLIKVYSEYSSSYNIESDEFKRRFFEAGGSIELFENFMTYLEKAPEGHP